MSFRWRHASYGEAACSGVADELGRDSSSPLKNSSGGDPAAAWVPEAGVGEFRLCRMLEQCMLECTYYVQKSCGKADLLKQCI